LRFNCARAGLRSAGPVVSAIFAQGPSEEDHDRKHDALNGQRVLRLQRQRSPADNGQIAVCYTRSIIQKQARESSWRLRPKAAFRFLGPEPSSLPSTVQGPNQFAIIADRRPKTRGRANGAGRIEQHAAAGHPASAEAAVTLAAPGDALKEWKCSLAHSCNFTKLLLERVACLYRVQGGATVNDQVTSMEEIGERLANMTETELLRFEEAAIAVSL
jgi:hypothetical protein